MLRNSTGSVYFTRTGSPCCMPGVHEPAGTDSITRSTSFVNNLSGVCNTLIELIEPSRSTTNATTTRPEIPCSNTSTGYLTRLCTQVRKSCRSPPRNFGIVSTTSQGSSASAAPPGAGGTVPDARVSFSAAKPTTTISGTVVAEASPEAETVNSNTPLRPFSPYFSTPSSGRSLRSRTWVPLLALPSVRPNSKASSRVCTSLPFTI